MAPRNSTSAALTMSAARVSSDGPKPAAWLLQALGAVAGHLEQAGGQRVGHGRDDDEVAQALQQVLGEAARVLAGLDDLVDDAEDGGPVVGRERVDGLVEQRVGRVAEQLDGEVVGDAVGAGAAEQLVEDAERVAHRARRRRGRRAAARWARA